MSGAAEAADGAPECCAKCERLRRRAVRAMQDRRRYLLECLALRGKLAAAEREITRLRKGGAE